VERELLSEMVCFVDGGCNNITHNNAYGSFIIFNKNGFAEHETFVLHTYTSNEAEYESLIKLLEYILEFDGHEEYFWRIYSDSKLIVNQMIGKWGIRAKNLKPLHEKAVSLLDRVPHRWLDWTSRKNVENVLGH
jgi:ribonuclease HI